MKQREHKDAVIRDILSLKEKVDAAQVDQNFNSQEQQLYEKIDEFICEVINDNFKL